MVVRSVCALACALAMTQFNMVAYAETPQQAPAQFRSVAPQTFTAEELQAYGLSNEQAQRAMALQQQGYHIVALTPEEAQNYKAGITQTEWILIGIGVLIILAIA